MSWTSGSDHQLPRPRGAGLPPDEQGAIRPYWFLLLGCSSALVFIGVALGAAVLVHGKNGGLHVDQVPHVSTWALALAVAGLGVVCLVIAHLVERPLDGTSDASLLASYRQRLFAWVGLGDVPAFAGVALVALSTRFWVYPVGVVFAFIADWHVAPTAAHLARDQEQLDHSHHRRSLRAALATTPAKKTRLW